MAATRHTTGAAVFVALALFGHPALAAKTCVIVYSGGTSGDWQEKYWHEMAHCNGWTHPIRASSFGKAFTPPPKFLHLYPGPLDARYMTPAKAMKECGAFGCQWFE
jgi:hypothetical protein